MINVIPLYGCETRKKVKLEMRLLKYTLGWMLGNADVYKEQRLILNSAVQGHTSVST